MTIGLLVALVAVNVAYLVLLDRKDRRDREERAVLLQRIQAPEAAVYEHATRGPVEPDTGELPMSDEQLARQEEHARAIALIESFERPAGVA